MVVIVVFVVMPVAMAMPVVVMRVARAVVQPPCAEQVHAQAHRSDGDGFVVVDRRRHPQPLQ